MKNINKSKLIARMMLLILLLASAVTLTACPGYGYRTANFVCHSYDEMVAYASTHKQEYEADNCIFLLFDVDKYDNIFTDKYVGETMWHDGVSEFFKLSQTDKIGDDHIAFSIKSYFHMNKDSQDSTVIKDTYGIECQYMGFTSIEEVEDNSSGIINSMINSDYSNETNRYLSVYSVYVNGIYVIDIEINHEHKATQEELDTIVKIFVDNVKIIK